MADDLETEKFPPEGALSARTDGQSEPDLVPASVRQKDSERRELGRRRWAIVGATLCVAVLAGMSWYAQSQRHLAEAVAEKSQKQAARMLAVTAAGVFAKSAPLGLLLATESLNISKGADNEQILRAMLAQPMGIPLRGSGPTLSIITTAMSSDGRWIVSGGAEGKVRVWDGRHPHSEPQVLAGHESESGISAVAVSSDGRWVVAGGTDRMVRMWDRESTKPTLLTSWTNEAVVSSVAVSSDGRWVVAGGTDGKVRVWDRENPSAVPLTVGVEGEEPSAITRVAVSGDAHWVLSGGQNGMVRVWDRQLQEAAPQAWRALVGSVTGLAVSGDGRWVAVGGSNGVVRVWDRNTTDPEELSSWGYESVVTSVAMSSDGGWVVTGGADGTLRVKRPGGGDWPLLWRAHQGLIQSVSMSGDGRWVVSGGEDGTLRLWDQQLLGGEPEGWRVQLDFDQFRCAER